MNTAASRSGLFIAFEGPDGSGKSTQARALAEALRAEGHRVVLTREPGGTPLGETLRGLVLDPDHAPIDPRTEALLFAAARSAHVEQLIAPELAAGATVVTDRYIDSSVAYQGLGRGLGAERIAALNEWATDGLRPDLTVVLDLDAATAAARRTGRETSTGAGPDRMEQTIADAHELLRHGFLERAAADPDRYLILDADGDPEGLTRRILEACRVRAERAGAPASAAEDRS